MICIFQTVNSQERLDVERVRAKHADFLADIWPALYVLHTVKQGLSNSSIVVAAMDAEMVDPKYIRAFVTGNAGEGMPKDVSRGLIHSAGVQVLYRCVLRIELRGEHHWGENNISPCGVLECYQNLVKHCCDAEVSKGLG